MPGESGFTFSLVVILRVMEGGLQSKLIEKHYDVVLIKSLAQ